MYLYVQMVQRTLKEDVHEFVQPAQPKTTILRVATLVLSGFLKPLFSPNQNIDPGGYGHQGLIARYRHFRSLINRSNQSIKSIWKLVSSKILT